MVRSDWSKKWTDDPVKAKELAADPDFPGVSLDAIKFLQLKRKILFHGHEPLDTDTTPTLEGEEWLMHHGFTQAEGVANLDLVPATGCLVDIGYPKFRGGLGGYARYIAICPPDARTARRSRAPTRRCRSPTRSCTGTRRSATGSGRRAHRGGAPRRPSVRSPRGRCRRRRCARSGSRS